MPGEVYLLAGSCNGDNIETIPFWHSGGSASSHLRAGCLMRPLADLKKVQSKRKKKQERAITIS
jgi:nicotinic acid mononucleotide adenylyltransferase